ncbi:unnamed protein product, partial [marine sediment metagenome]
ASVDTRALSLLMPQDYIHAATSDNTRTAYQNDIRHFRQWGAVLPTTSDVIVRYLHHYADQLNPRTLVRRITAIKQWHEYQGFSDPTKNPVVGKTLRGIQNVHGKPKVKALPLTVDALIQMVDLLNESPSLFDIRNNALIQIGFFGAFRRSELVKLWLKCFISLMYTRALI